MASNDDLLVADVATLRLPGQLAECRGHERGERRELGADRGAQGCDGLVRGAHTMRDPLARRLDGQLVPLECRPHLVHPCLGAATARVRLQAPPFRVGPLLDDVVHFVFQTRHFVLAGAQLQAHARQLRFGSVASPLGLLLSTAQHLRVRAPAVLGGRKLASHLTQLSLRLLQVHPQLRHQTRRRGHVVDLGAAAKLRHTVPRETRAPITTIVVCGLASRQIRHRHSRVATRPQRQRRRTPGEQCTGGPRRGGRPQRRRR